MQCLLLLKVREHLVVLQLVVWYGELQVLQVLNHLTVVSSVLVPIEVHHERAVCERSHQPLCCDDVMEYVVQYGAVWCSMVQYGAG